MTRRRQLSGAFAPTLIAAASNWARQIGAEFDLAPRDIYRIDLCLSELVTNIVSYNAPPAANPRISIEILVEPDSLSLTVLDPSPAYNPFVRMPPPVRHDPDDAQVGGYGLRLMRDFSDAFHYERSADHNRIELTFLLSRTAMTPDGGVRIPRARDRRRSSGTAAWGQHERRINPDRRHNGFLSWSQIFSDVAYADVEEIIDGMPVRDYVDSTVLLEPGHTNGEVLVVLRGRLLIWLQAPGVGEYIEIGLGGCAGEMSVIDGKPVSAHVVAEAGARLLAIDASTFTDRILTLRHVSRNLIVALSERMRSSNEQVIKRIRQELELEQIHRDLLRAQSIQNSLLPRAPLFADTARLDCAGSMRAARDVGGDFYDLLHLGEDHVFFVIADVCGKGLPAALYMVRAIEGLRGQTSIGGAATYLAELANRFNRQMCAYNDAQQFLTAFLGLLDLRTRRLHFVNAGHVPPLLAHAREPFRQVADPVNPVFGMYDSLVYRVGEATLQPDSVLLLLTDGVTEAEDAGGHYFGEQRLRDCLNAAETRTAAGLIDAVLAAVTAFAGEPNPSDDITLLALRLLSAPDPA